MTTITKNEYTGDGSNSIFNITFPYIEFEDVKVFIDSVLQTIDDDYTFATATAISFTNPRLTGPRYCWSGSPVPTISSSRSFQARLSGPGT